MYTLSKLVDDCASKRAGKLEADLPKERKKELLQDAWKAFNSWINEVFEKGKGVSISTFGSITWEVVPGTDETVKKRPIFILAEQFAKANNIIYKKPLKAPEIVHCEEVNYSKIAIRSPGLFYKALTDFTDDRYSQMLTKNMVFSAIRELLHKIGQLVGNGQKVSIELSVGTLVSHERKLRMVFNANYFAKKSPLCEDTEAQSAEDIKVQGSVVPTTESASLVSAESQAALEANCRLHAAEIEREVLLEDVDDETEDPGLFPSAATHTEEGIKELCRVEKSGRIRAAEEYIKQNIRFNDDDVLDNAYKDHQRYALDMVRQQAVELSEAHQIELQRQRVEQELQVQKERRLVEVKRTQEFIKEQMRGRMELKAKELQQWKQQQPAAYPPKLEGLKFMVSRSKDRLGTGEVTEEIEQLRNDRTQLQQDLLSTLQTQMEEKNLRQAQEKQEQILEDMKLLNAVKEEIEEQRRKQVEQTAKTKKYLMDSWRRDQQLKAVIQDHQGVLHSTSPSKVLRDVPSRFPLPPPSAPSPSFHRPKTDFSVGFDLRAATARKSDEFD